MYRFQSRCVCLPMPGLLSHAAYKSDIQCTATALCEKFLKLDSVPIKKENEGSVLDAHVLLFLVHFAPSQYVHCNYCFMMNEKKYSESEKALLEMKQVQCENEKLKTKLDATNHLLQTTQTELFRVNQTLSETNRSVKKLARKVKQLEQGSKAIVDRTGISKNRLILVSSHSNSHNSSNKATDNQNGSSKKRKFIPPKSISGHSSGTRPHKRLKKAKKGSKPLGPPPPPPSGIRYKYISPGRGAPCKTGDKLTVYYVGQTADGQVFDKKLSGKGFEFVLGKGEVIKGWEIGLKGMRVGEKRKLTIPPELAYGRRGSKPKIGKNATLIFTVEIVAINGAK